MEIKEKKAKICLMIDGKQVGVGEIAEFTPESFDGEVAEDALHKSLTELTEEAHKKRGVAIAEAWSYCEGYVRGLNIAFEECQKIMNDKTNN